MMYRYHRSRRDLGRPSVQRGVKRQGLIGWPRWMRGGRPDLRSPGGIQSRVRVSGWVKGILYVLMPVVAVAMTAWGLVAVTRTMTQSSFFDLREIRTIGLERLVESDVLKRLRPISGRTLFDLDLVSLRGTLLSEPWIKEVSVRREYPDALAVQVIERHPVAVLAGRQMEAIVDETGTVIEAWPNGGEIPGQWSSLPVIHGVEAASLRDHDSEMMKRFFSALEILRAAPPIVGQSLDLDVSRPDDLRVQRHGVWLRFGSSEFDGAWERFLSVEGDIERRHEGVREVDLRFPEQVIVR